MRPEPSRRAIAIRQPWAWAVIYAGKDVENRAAPRQFKAAVGRRIFVHASKTMTKAEYADAVEFMAGLGVECPAPADLLFGGIVGSALVRAMITRPNGSPWWRGPAALALADARPEPFLPVRRQVGLFQVQP